MRLRGKAIPLVTAADIDQLVADSVNEDVRLDFKTTMYRHRGTGTPVPADKAAVALCKDVASMANARGGVIVCGVAATSGIASAVVGVPHADIDAEKLWIDNILGQRVSPKIPGVHVREVACSSGDRVLLIGVPSSLARPHAFTPATSEPPQWWRRGLAGNVPMDVAELRSLFLEMSGWERDAAVWREDRMRHLTGGVGVPPILRRPTLIVHMQPLGGPRAAIAEPPGMRESLPLWLRNFLPPMVGGMMARPNIDGWLLVARLTDSACHHAQVFRASGAVEVRVDCGPQQMPGTNPTNGGMYFNGAALELRLSRTVKSAFLWAERMGLEGPFLVSARLLNVNGATLAGEGLQAVLAGDLCIDRPDIELPQLLVESAAFDVATALDPMRDALWQAAGWDASPVRGANGIPSYAHEVNATTWRD